MPCACALIIDRDGRKPRPICGNNFGIKEWHIGIRFDNQRILAYYSHASEMPHEGIKSRYCGGIKYGTSFPGPIKSQDHSHNKISNIDGASVMPFYSIKKIGRIVYANPYISGVSGSIPSFPSRSISFRYKFLSCRIPINPSIVRNYHNRRFKLQIYPIMCDAYG